MARPKETSQTEGADLRFVSKPLADGNKSIYLDIYWKGSQKV